MIGKPHIRSIIVVEHGLSGSLEYSDGTISTPLIVIDRKGERRSKEGLEA